MGDEIKPLWGKSPAAEALEAVRDFREQIRSAFYVVPKDLECGPMITATEVQQRSAELRAREIDRQLRQMLGQWVSELEPTYVMHGGQLLGLAWAGHPGRIVVYNGFDPRPMLARVVDLIEQEQDLDLSS